MYAVLHSVVVICRHIHSFIAKYVYQRDYTFSPLYTLGQLLFIENEMRCNGSSNTTVCYCTVDLMMLLILIKPEG